MAFTYKVNKDKSVTILNDGVTFITQVDDPTTPGWDTFATAAKAEDWAKAAIVQFEEEIAQQAVVDAEIVAKAEEYLAKATETVGFDGVVPEEAAE